MTSSLPPAPMIQFLYCNARNETNTFTLIAWRESGHYLQGRCLEDGQWKTFRIDRVLSYSDSGERFLIQPRQAPPPSVRKAAEGGAKKGPEILFTGFAEERRAELEAIAVDTGLKVVKSVTSGLTFLVGGRNAGPKKVEQARQRSIYILNESQYLALIETGELPDDTEEFSGERGYSNQIADPAIMFGAWHFQIDRHHWVTLGVKSREFVGADKDKPQKKYTAWAIDNPVKYDFHDGDIFYPRLQDNSFLQVTCNLGTGFIEVHTGEISVPGSRTGYLATEEQLGFWLETGLRPETLQRVYRGTSKAGLFGWQLSE